jgi:spore coat protein CotH
VYDVLVRYTGSRYQRKNGVNLPAWTAPGPSQPSPLKVFSWRVSFPRWAEFEGKRTINLNKQYQACPGVLNALEGRLFWEAGVPTNNFRFARLHVNGGYYGYMMEVENIDEAFLAKHVEKTPGAPIGDMFKFDGAVDDQGPWGRADFNPLPMNRGCPMYTVADRYRFTYERQSNDWRESDPKGHDELVAMIDELAKIKAAAGTDESPAVRAFFEKHFDVKQLVTHWAVRNFVGVWDDGVHNYYLYKRSDGKWTLMPQDFDLDFGGDPVDAEWKGFANPPTMSFFHGEQGTAKTAGGLNQLKVQLIRAYRKEFAARVQELARTTLSEANVDKLLGEVTKDFSAKDWMEAPTRRCDMTARVESARKWIKDRHAFLAGGVK